MLVNVISYGAPVIFQVLDILGTFPTHGTLIVFLWYSIFPTLTSYYCKPILHFLSPVNRWLNPNFTEKLEAIGWGQTQLPTTRSTNKITSVSVTRRAVKQSALNSTWTCSARMLSTSLHATLKEASLFLPKASLIFCLLRVILLRLSSPFLIASTPFLLASFHHLTPLDFSHL